MLGYCDGNEDKLPLNARELELFYITSVHVECKCEERRKL